METLFSQLLQFFTLVLLCCRWCFVTLSAFSFLFLSRFSQLFCFCSIGLYFSRTKRLFFFLLRHVLLLLQLTMFFLLLNYLLSFILRQLCEMLNLLFSRLESLTFGFFSHLLSYFLRRGQCQKLWQLVLLGFFLILGSRFLSQREYFILDDRLDTPALFADEVDRLFGQGFTVLNAPSDCTDGHVVLIDGHKGDEGLQDVADGPGGLPVLRVVVGKCQTYLLFDLEAARGCQEHNVGWLEWVTTWESDDPMIEPAFKRCVRWPSDRKMPLKRFILQWLCIVVWRGITLHVFLLLLYSLHGYAITTWMHF